MAIRKKRLQIKTWKCAWIEDIGRRFIYSHPEWDSRTQCKHSEVFFTPILHCLMAPQQHWEFCVQKDPTHLWMDLSAHRILSVAHTSTGCVKLWVTVESGVYVTCTVCIKRNVCLWRISFKRYLPCVSGIPQLNLPDICTECPVRGMHFHCKLWKSVTEVLTGLEISWSTVIMQKGEHCGSYILQVIPYCST